MTILSTIVAPTTAYLGDRVTLHSEVSETIPSTHFAMWIIDFDETTDSSTPLWQFANQDRVINYEWSPFVSKIDMGSEVQINESMLNAHTLTFILAQGDGNISIASNPELFTISDPINVFFKIHLYNKVKKLGNQWFYLKDEINTLVTKVINRDVPNKVYPIGSIYMSVNSTNPSELFGGTWEQIKDRFLLASGTTYTNGATGGEATHKLIERELPYIEGTFPHIAYGEHKVSGHTVYTNGTVSQKEGSAGTTSNKSIYKFSFGQGQSHNNMPPYLTVYVWKRIG